MERRGFLGLLPFLPFAMKKPVEEKTEINKIMENVHSNETRSVMHPVKVAKHITITGDDGKDYNVLVTEKESNNFAKVEMPKFDTLTFQPKSSQGLT